MTDYRANLEAIEQQIEAACKSAGRSRDSVLLVAVSKGHSTAAIKAFRDLGVTTFGESYVQEWQEKSEVIDGVTWHFIGHLQSNKARFVADEVALVHSVDRKSLMKALSRRSDERVEVLLQINVGEDPAKFGADPGEMMTLLEQACGYESLVIRGLMTIPPFTDDAEDARPHFQALAAAFERARDWLGVHAPERLAAFTELSMGMSADFDIAIEEGATIIRVGTSLFGERPR